jgi:hypothetical protein
MHRIVEPFSKVARRLERRSFLNHSSLTIELPARGHPYWPQR